MSLTSNKHKIIQKWVQGFLKENSLGHLYFQTADVSPSMRVLVPQSGEFINKTDIFGNMYKTYTFLFVGYETIDTTKTNTNTNNLEMFDRFCDWILKQQKTENFPDLGDRCSEYELVPLQNMANVTLPTDGDTAKYVFAVQINYIETPDTTK